MANITGSFRAGLIEDDTPNTTTATWPMPGAVRAVTYTIGSNPIVYKNMGYYSPSGIWESWVSVGFPSTFNNATNHGVSHFQDSTLQHYPLKR